MNIPNPLNNYYEVDNIPDTDELLKIAILAMFGIGFLVFWLEKKVNDLGKVLDKNE